MRIVTAVAAAVCSPLDLSGAPVAFRTFLMCRMSRITIMSVRRMLNEREIEREEVSKLTEMAVPYPVPDPR